MPRDVMTKGLLRSAVNAKYYALEAPKDIREGKGTATPEDIAELENMVKSGDNAEKMLRHEAESNS